MTNDIKRLKEDFYFYILHAWETSLSKDLRLHAVIKEDKYDDRYSSIMEICME